MKKLKKGEHITQTSQPRSLAKLSETGKNLTINKTEKTESIEKEEQIKLMLSLCDSLNELYEKLSKLSNVMGEKITEHNLNKGEIK